MSQSARGWFGRVTRLDAPVLDLLCHGQERLLDVCSILGGRLEERDGQLVREFLRRK
jgi:hypothetical protein